jgi:predicted glycosyltransferase
MAIENKANTKIRVKIEGTRLMPNKAKAKAIKEYRSGSLLSNLDTNQPDAKVPTKAAIGIAKSTLPNWASFKLNADLIVGIRDAQDAKHNPERKKNVLSAKRCMCCVFMLFTLTVFYLTL